MSRPGAPDRNERNAPSIASLWRCIRVSRREKRRRGALAHARVDSIYYSQRCPCRWIAGKHTI